MRTLFCLLWSVRVFAAFNLTWGTPAVNLNPNPPLGDTDSNAYIAMDPMGNAMATWSRTVGKGASEHVWAACYNHSQRVWTGALRISGKGSACHSQVALDEEGNAIFIWEEGFPSRIYSRTFNKDGLWIPNLSEPAETIHPSKNGQTFPQIAIDAKGNALVIWSELCEGKKQIFSAKKPVGMSWIPLGQISAGHCDAALIPSKSLCSNRQGMALAVWEAFNGQFSEVHAAKFAEGMWQKALVISEEKEARSPSIGIDKMGDAVIVWSQNHAIFSRILMQDTLSATPLQISHPAFAAERPHVGVDEEGNAVAVFERYNAMHKFIAGATLSKGAKNWSSPIDLSGPSPSDAATAGYPVLAMNAIGDGVAIWKEWTGSNTVIQGAGFSLGTWSSIKTLSSFSGNSGAKNPAYDISVALNQAGNILAVWPEAPSGYSAQQIKATGGGSEQIQTVEEDVHLAQIAEESPQPIKTNPQQIKATTGVGLANIGPMPPIAHPKTILSGIVKGHQVMHRFPAHADLINILSWESPGNISHFNIYRGNLSSRIAQTRISYFEDHQRPPKQREIYLITSVDHNKQESGPMTIVVEPR